MRIFTLSDVKLPLGKSESELFSVAKKKLGKEPAYFSIVKKSLDARNKKDIRFVYTIEYSAEKNREEDAPLEKLPKAKRPQKPVLVVGAGPAGLFCALRLLDRGITPWLIERGAPVEERERTIETFFNSRLLDENCNVQFGEGGAGTFSDGKLNTQTHSPLNREVIKTFLAFGAPQEIAYLSKPHIGSDRLKKVVASMRKEILDRGGKVLFHTRFEDMEIKDGKTQTAILKNLLSGNTEKLDVSAVVLAIGHSARDTFEMLRSRGVCMRSKDFAVGVRIEHLQEKIGFAQYESAYKLLPAADYKLVSHASERAVFTFCMCPGGFVMPATSEAECVVTNGMSNYARDGKNANAALIAQVTRADFSSDDPLAGMYYQRQIEKNAYFAGGEKYAAPVQLVGDFLRDKTSTGFGEVTPTYAAGTTFSDLRAVLPLPIVGALKTAIVDMDKRLRGFACPDALLTGAETRTSSPVRIERNESLQSVNVQGLYPCGEGAGYAGGITSSAADGLRVADAIYNEFLS